MGGDGSGSNVIDGGDGSGGNVSNGERWGAADEASLASPQLTSCCAALRVGERGGGDPNRPRTVPVHGPGVGDPCFRV